MANFNLDGIGRNQGDTLLMLGKPYSDLGTVLDETNAAHPELHLTIDDNPDLDEQFFPLSDQYAFSHQGIPSMCFTGVVNRDIDHVTDSPDKVDAELETRILRLVFYVGQAIANRNERPAWVKPAP